MVEIKEYKKPLIIIGVVIGTLILLLSVGFTVGLLSEDPDGLERTLIDANGEEWVESLPSVWDPILGWIQNDYIASIVGVFLSLFIIISIFYVIAFMTKRKAENRVTISPTN